MKAREATRVAATGLTTRAKLIKSAGEAQLEEAENAMMHTRIEALYCATYLEVIRKNKSQMEEQVDSIVED